MEIKERLSCYENLYLQELERKEKINARLNLPLAISVALIGLLAFMLKNTPTEMVGFWPIIFWFFFAASCLSLIIGFVFFRLCWFGHTDQLMPTAQEIENYYQTLKAHYAPYDDAKNNTNIVFRDFLFDGYLKYSTINAINNDRRTYNLYRTTVSITVALSFAFLSFAPFQLSTLDYKANQRNMETASMTDNRQPPPPPPPPGSRNVKGNVTLPSAPPPPKIPPVVKKP